MKEFIKLKTCSSIIRQMHKVELASADVVFVLFAQSRHGLAPAHHIPERGKTQRNEQRGDAHHPALQLSRAGAGQTC